MPRLSTCSEFLGPTLPANPLRFFLVRKATNPKLHRGAWNKSRGSGFLEKSLRNFPSAIQSAPRRLDASCRSAHGPVLWSENSPVFQALEQVSLCPTWRAKRASAYVLSLGGTIRSLEIKGASGLNKTPTQEGLPHSRFAEPLARILFTTGLTCSKYESNMFGMEIEYSQCCRPRKKNIFVFDLAR